MRVAALAWDVVTRLPRNLVLHRVGCFKRDVGACVVLGADGFEALTCDRVLSAGGFVGRLTFVASR